LIATAGIVNAEAISIGVLNSSATRVLRASIPGSYPDRPPAFSALIRAYFDARRSVPTAQTWHEPFETIVLMRIDERRH
jgi:hypothetical protein